jgi:sugar/nucleoside kinase (ribokinase family)
VLPAWLGSVRSRGISTSIDTNWDPHETWALAHEAIAQADVFLPNAAELRAVTGLADVEAAGHAIAAAGTAVALKNGADGGILWTPDGGRATADVVPVDVVDTTGAGDSFDAGFLAAYVGGHPPAECLRQAVAAGSLSTRAAGGTASQPTADELARALAVSP